MRLIIDNREPNAIIQYLNAITNNEQSKAVQITIEVKPLDIGDYEIYYDGCDKPCIIVERKSLADLESSIKDGRYKEQSFRLDKSPIHNHNIIYLIEGNVQNYRNGGFRPTIYSTMLSLMYFKGFSVIHSNNQIETGEIIYNFIQKLWKEREKPGFYQIQRSVDREQKEQEQEQQLEQEQEQSDYYLACIKTSKKSFITTENIFELMLMQIPGISNVSAAAISERYLNLDALIQSLKTATCSQDFSTIRLPNGRRLNKNIVDSLKRYLKIE